MNFNFFSILNPFCWDHADKPVRLAATRTDAYQAMLERVVAHAQLTDRLGFEGLLFTEQHHNLEGVHEVTNNPIMLDMFVAAHTERVKLGQCGICLPFANPRHAHEINALQGTPLPDSMILIPGVIETTNNYVEHPELVAERIERAVRAVGDRERVIAGTDCGFGTLAGDVFVAEDVVWAKLESLRDGAGIASDRLRS